ncbi:MAG: hypothetical protein ACQEXB_16405 [Bacillota bacterium]
MLDAIVTYGGEGRTLAARALVLGMLEVPPLPFNLFTSSFGHAGFSTVTF